MIWLLVGIAFVICVLQIIVVGMAIFSRDPQDGEDDEQGIRRYI